MDLELIASASPEIWCFALSYQLVPPTSLARSGGIVSGSGELAALTGVEEKQHGIAMTEPFIHFSSHHCLSLGPRGIQICVSLLLYCKSATAACLLTLAASCRSPARSSPAPARASSSCSSADTCCCSSSPRHLTTSLSSPQSTYLPA